MVKEWVLKLLIHLSVGEEQAPIGGCHRGQAAATSTGASPTDSPIVQALFSAMSRFTFSYLSHSRFASGTMAQVDRKHSKLLLQYQCNYFHNFHMFANPHTNTSCSSCINHHMTERNLVPRMSSLCSI